MLITIGGHSFPPQRGLRCLICGYSLATSHRGGKPFSWVMGMMNNHLAHAHQGNKYQETVANGNTDLMLLWTEVGTNSVGFTQYLRGVTHEGLYFPTKIVRRNYATKGAREPWPVETCFSPTGKFLWETYSLDPKNPSSAHYLVVCPDLAKLYHLSDRSTFMWQEYLHMYLNTPDDQKADYLGLLQLHKELS